MEKLVKEQVVKEAYDEKTGNTDISYTKEDTNADAVMKVAYINELDKLAGDKVVEPKPEPDPKSESTSSSKGDQMQKQLQEARSVQGNNKGVVANAEELKKEGEKKEKVASVLDRIKTASLTPPKKKSILDRIKEL